MEIQLNKRKQEHVKIFYERVQDQEIQKMFPSHTSSVNEALRLFKESEKKNANSYGRVIYVEGKYIGDIWCFNIEPKSDIEAMLSYCIFDKHYWHKGIATKACHLFLEEVKQKYKINKMGAFVYSTNIASIKILKKNGFVVEEIFVEDGIESQFLVRNM